VPVPRRLDRRPPEQDLTRTNERITASEVRLIDQDGQQVGVLKTPDALRFAQERDLDLVEVAPQARPPVARVLDYSKYKYEQAQKQKQARKHQQQITVREIKFRPKIAQHDYDTKKGHVARFLLHKYKVKITIMFRGREVAHPERGVAILDRLAEELSALGVVEQSPTLDGRNMAMLLAPSKGVLSGNVDGLQSAANGDAAAAASGDGAAPADGAATSEAPAAPAGQSNGAPAAGPQTDGGDAQPQEAAASQASEPAEPATSEATSEAATATEPKPAQEEPKEQAEKKPAPSAKAAAPSAKPASATTRAKPKSDGASTPRTKPKPASGRGDAKGGSGRGSGGAAEHTGDAKAPRKRAPASSRAS
jgi:translation initiation factor IF-3